MIKIWAESLDKNFEVPRESFLFVKDLTTFSNDFEVGYSAKESDCIVIPQYSNNYINNLIGNYIFDKEKADYLFNLGKPIIIVNTGGGCPYEWKQFPIYEYIQGEYCKNLIIFSTECYSWHRDFLPKSVTYLPFDYVGFVDFGLGLRSIPPIQTKEQYLSRVYDTAYIMNTYPPTRDKVWEIVHENSWKHFSYQTIPNGDQTRMDWSVMIGKLHNAKITFVPDGATAKTERHIFAPCCSAIAKSEDALLEYAFAWIDGNNCIEMVHDFMEGLDRHKEAEYEQNGHHLRILNKVKTKQKIVEYLNNPDKLYEVYVNGWCTESNYRLPEYNKNYIAKKIKEHL